MTFRPSPQQQRNFICRKPMTFRQTLVWFYNLSPKLYRGIKRMPAPPKEERELRKAA